VRHVFVDGLLCSKSARQSKDSCFVLRFQFGFSLVRASAYSQWEKYTGKPASVVESNLTLLKDLFGQTLTDPQGRSVDLDEVLGGGKYVGIYVGAEWAASCAPLAAALKRTYEKINEKSMLPTFEIVYVSADKANLSCIFC
jgi:hypothetical protein